MNKYTILIGLMTREERKNLVDRLCGKPLRTKAWDKYLEDNKDE
jgi:hypothetical protein